MKKVTFSCLTLATLLQLIPSNGNAANIQVNKKKTNRTEMKQDTIPANSTKKESEEGERNVMLNASDANKPREIQIGLPSEDVNVYENGLPAVYSSTVHKLAASESNPQPCIQRITGGISGTSRRISRRLHP